MIKKIKKNSLFIKHKKYARFFFFCLVGGTAFLIDWSVFNFFYRFTSFFTMSIALGLVISMIFNFIVNRNITFSAKTHPIKKQISKWLIVYMISFFVRVFIGKMALSILDGGILNANIAYLLGIAIATPINFFGSLLWAFKKPSD